MPSVPIRNLSPLADPWGRWAEEHIKELERTVAQLQTTVLALQKASIKR